MAVADKEYVADKLKKPGPASKPREGTKVALPERSVQVLLELIEHLQWVTVRGGCGLDPWPPGSILPRQLSGTSSASSGQSTLELGLQVVETARVHVGILLARIERLQMVVLINDWRMAQQVWWELVPDLRTPLLELNFLWELWSGTAEPAVSDGPDLARLAEHIGLLQAQVELLFCRGGDVIAFSDLLEQGLLPWLREVGAYLDRVTHAQTV